MAYYGNKGNSNDAEALRRANKRQFEQEFASAKSLLESTKRHELSRAKDEIRRKVEREVSTTKMLDDVTSMVRKNYGQREQQWRSSEISKIKEQAKREEQREETRISAKYQTELRKLESRLKTKYNQ